MYFLTSRLSWKPASADEASFKRRILHAPNAIQTIDN